MNKTNVVWNRKTEKLFANKVQTSHKKGRMEQNTKWAQKQTAEEPNRET